MAVNNAVPGVNQKTNWIDCWEPYLKTYPDTTFTRFLNVEYIHLKTGDGGDLYVTTHGLPFLNNLRPENWYAKKWFKEHREKLTGTSTIYKVPTKITDGKSVDLVVKWCRVGQDVPLETKIIEDVINAEFNSPFEEFSLVEELRTNSYGPKDIKIMLQKPLGIYVPPERLQLWQTGRSRHKIMSKIAKHPGVEIDILRQYILIYKWVKGLNAVDAFEKAGISHEKLKVFTRNVINVLKKKGFRVLDQKPVHFIVRLKPNRTILKNRKNEIPYALVDFELLERTREHEREVKTLRRKKYLSKQRDRFQEHNMETWPKHLLPMNIMGVDYVWGLTESTSGMLWVVGKDPDLFDYFQPERWRKTPRKKISRTDDRYYTKTKDAINIVWKISRVGEKPEPSAGEQGEEIINYGYNSPFEEFALALELSRKGIPTVYPRAIYMTGLTTDTTSYIADDSRFQSHRSILTPDGHLVLRKDHDYIKLWGFWNGLDELLAVKDGEYYKGISLLNALRRGYITEEQYVAVLQRADEMLAACGMKHLYLQGNHILLTLNLHGKLIRNREGLLEIRLCNFELIEKIERRDE